MAFDVALTAVAPGGVGTRWSDAAGIAVGARRVAVTAILAAKGCDFMWYHRRRAVIEPIGIAGSQQLIDAPVFPNSPGISRRGVAGSGEQRQAEAYGRGHRSGTGATKLGEEVTVPGSHDTFSRRTAHFL